MPRYLVNHRYSATRDGQMFGPYEEGSAVELTEPDADWVNRDSPGTLTAADAPAKAAKPPAKAAKQKAGSD